MRDVQNRKTHDSALSVHCAKALPIFGVLGSGSACWSGGSREPYLVIWMTCPLHVNGHWVIGIASFLLWSHGEFTFLTLGRRHFDQPAAQSKSFVIVFSMCDPDVSNTTQFPCLSIFETDPKCVMFTLATWNVTFLSCDSSAVDMISVFSPLFFTACRLSSCRIHLAWTLLILLSGGLGAMSSV